MKKNSKQHRVIFRLTAAEYENAREMIFGQGFLWSGASNMSDLVRTALERMYAEMQMKRPSPIIYNGPGVEQLPDPCPPDAVAAQLEREGLEPSKPESLPSENGSEKKTSPARPKRMTTKKERMTNAPKVRDAKDRKPTSANRVARATPDRVARTVPKRTKKPAQKG